MSPEVAASKKDNFTGTGSAKFTQVEVGHVLSMTSYLRVLGISGLNLDVEDQRGVKFRILQSGSNLSETLVDQTMHSANAHNRTVECSRTELLEVFSRVGDAVFTMTYRKQPDVLDAFESIKTGNVLKSHAEQKKALKLAMAGKTRIITGYVISSENAMGRTLVYDLDQKGPRLIDHRTVDALVFKDVRYVVK